MGHDIRDRADITEVLLRYATGIDRRDWATFRTAFSEDPRHERRIAQMTAYGHKR